MDLTALKLSGGKLPPLDKLVTSEGLQLLAKEGVSLEALENALASTTDPVVSLPPKLSSNHSDMPSGTPTCSCWSWVT